LDAARELRYRPNALARSLRTEVPVVEFRISPTGD
jgi:DNA-binding LacI/PurR family transcriptional regulator